MEKKQIKMRAKEDDLKGAYSNLVQIIHTKEEFYLDFFNVIPPQGILVSRVIMSPGHLKRMVVALQEGMRKYESKFGKVEASEKLETEIGFKP